MMQSDVLELNQTHPNYETPKVMIQPEPVYKCDPGGFVTISPLIYGTNLDFYWEAISHSSIRILDTQRRQNLTIGPITSADLQLQYRLVARDSRGQFVRTISSKLQLNKKGFALKESFLKIRDQQGKMKELTREANNSFSEFSTEKTLDELLQKELPVFISQPKDTFVHSGTTVQLQTQHYRALSYAWYFNGAHIPDSNVPDLFIPNAIPRNEGVYVCVARNQYGSTCSNPARVALFK